MTSTIGDGRTTKCTCGREIYWITYTDKNGQQKSVPLDAVAPVWMRVHDPDERRDFWHKVEERQAMVSHFATCKDADRFSGSSRRKA